MLATCKKIARILFAVTAITFFVTFFAAMCMIIHEDQIETERLLAEIQAERAARAAK